MAFAATILVGCNMKMPTIEYEAHYDDEYSLFADSIVGIVDGTRQLVNTESATCVLLDTVADFNGDGLADALVTDVQACGGNAVGNAFFFVTYTRGGRFVRTNTFGVCVYDEPVVELWEGMKSVVINEEKLDPFTEEVEMHDERYVLVDTFALRAVSPSTITPMPTISFRDWQKEAQLSDMGEEEDCSGDSIPVEPNSDSAIFDDLYSGHCSWYCGGEVQNITASSSPKDYEADKAHDFDHTTFWSPSGSGIGESLVYTFHGSCPRITTIKVLNGDVTNEELWIQSARVKLMRMYVNDKPYALLAFEDSRTQQCFDIGIVGFHDPQAADWTLTFEVLETYPGTLRGVAIAELNFDGIDVH